MSWGEMQCNWARSVEITIMIKPKFGNFARVTWIVIYKERDSLDEGIFTIEKRKFFPLQSFASDCRATKCPQKRCEICWFCLLTVATCTSPEKERTTSTASPTGPLPTPLPEAPPNKVIITYAHCQLTSIAAFISNNSWKLTTKYSFLPSFQAKN